MRAQTLVLFGLIILGAIVLTFFLVGSSSTTAPSATSAAAAVIPFTTLAEGTSSAVTTPVNYVITSSADLAKLWQMINATTSLPSINFSANDVLAVFAGDEPSTGYAISVSSVKDSSTRNVLINLMAPGSGCATRSTTTTPYEIISVPATSLSLRHQVSTTTVACN